MRALARRFGEDEHRWALGRLFHDLDQEQTGEDSDRYAYVAAEWLREAGVEEPVVNAVLAHAHAGYRTDLISKAVVHADAIAGLRVAAALVRPERSAGMKVSSMKKKLKERSFAPGVNREEVYQAEATWGCPWRSSSPSRSPASSRAPRTSGCRAGAWHLRSSHRTTDVEVSWEVRSHVYESADAGGSQPQIQPVQRDQLAAAGELFAGSHADYPSFPHLFPDPARRARVLRLFFTGTVRDALAFGAGDGALAPDGRLLGVAVWLPPGAFPWSGRRKARLTPTMLAVLVATPGSFLGFTRLGANAELKHRNHLLHSSLLRLLDPRHCLLLLLHHCLGHVGDSASCAMIPIWIEPSAGRGLPPSRGTRPSPIGERSRRWTSSV